MKTYRKLNLRVKRVESGVGGWCIENTSYPGNKGDAILAYLNENCTWDGKEWILGLSTAIEKYVYHLRASLF
jgi:hypothetical protein